MPDGGEQLLGGHFVIEMNEAVAKAGHLHEPPAESLIEHAAFLSRQARHLPVFEGPDAMTPGEQVARGVKDRLDRTS
jgi:hypothetical protein